MGNKSKNIQTSEPDTTPMTRLGETSDERQMNGHRIQGAGHKRWETTEERSRTHLKRELPQQSTVWGNIFGEHRNLASDHHIHSLAIPKPWVLSMIAFTAIVSTSRLFQMESPQLHACHNALLQVTEFDLTCSLQTLKSHAAGRLNSNALATPKHESSSASPLAVRGLSQLQLLGWAFQTKVCHCSEGSN